MNEYRIVDMSNSKYIIKGISLGKGINSCLYMNQQNKIVELVITDGDVLAIDDGQIIFCIKNLSLENVERMFYSFYDVFYGMSIVSDNLRVRIVVGNDSIRLKLEECLKRVGLSLMDSSKKVFHEEVSAISKQNRVVSNESSDKDSEYTIEKDSSSNTYFDHDKDFSKEVSIKKKDKGKLSIVLFLLSGFLIVISFVIFLIS